MERTLRALADRELVAELPRRRFGHLLAGDASEAPEAPETTTSLEERVARLEDEVAALREALTRR